MMLSIFTWAWFNCQVMSDCDPMDCSLPGSSVQGISKARILLWVAISFSRGSSQTRDRTQVSCIGVFLVAQKVKILPTMWETQGQPPDGEDTLKKVMATYSSIVAWRSPWTEETGMGLQRVRHDWVTNTFHFLSLLTEPSGSPCMGLLATCMYFFVKHLANYFAHFIFLLYNLWILRVLFILDTSFLSDTHIVN